MYRRLITLGVLAAVPALAGSAHALAPVTGTLSKSGYTVIAISSGTGRTAEATRRGRTFTVKSPGAKMTLQLVSPRGSYAGTIVVGRKGARAIVGVKAGARLGMVKVLAGYGKPTTPLAARYIDASRTAKANSAGVPVGARSFGLTRTTVKEMSRETQGVPGPPAPPAPGGQPGPGGAGTANAGADPDQDGVPNGVDIDANGNGIIDANDPAAPQVAGFRTFTNLFVNLAETVNANAEPGSTTRIDAMMVRDQELVFLAVPTGATLDGNGLTWFSPGGTGQILPPGGQPGGTTLPFPDCCLHGGYGRISGTSQSAGNGTEFRIFPRAGSTQLRSGDTMVMRVPDGSAVKEIPGAIGFVFNTVPAVRSWSAGSRSATITYPVAANGTGARRETPFLLDASSLAVTFTVWRPQRSAIPAAGEPTGFMDIGHLKYQIQLPTPPGATAGAGATGPVQCGQSTLSTTDPNLVADTRGDVGALVDQANDHAADPAGTLSFTFDLGACITAKGGSTTAGHDAFLLHLEAMTPSGGDHANQDLYFKIV